MADAIYERKLKGGKQINLCLNKRNRFISITLGVLIALITIFNIAFFDIVSMDKKQIVRSGAEINVPHAIVFNNLISVESNRQTRDAMTVSAALDEESTLSDNKEGSSSNATISIGNIPLKTVEVVNTETIKVIPGGQSIGILLQTEGVSIVGFSPVVTEDNTTVSPASDAGLITGDFIVTINEEKIINNEQIAEIINQAGSAAIDCEIVYLRNGIRHNVTIPPVFCSDSQSWRIGLYVRDNTAGIGTLTFYEPDSHIYGALGHQVPDLEHGVSGENKGSIVRAAVQGIKIGVVGTPGEKLGVFLDEQWEGDIRTNGSFGIFGVLQNDPEVNYQTEAIPTAMINEVEVGPAKIYTVVEGEEIEEFDIEITKLMSSYKLTGKGMIIKITDQRLLDITGGIVQGMSGSPIIQNDMFVGAVTHVFVNDPTQGYGCFAEWMFEEAGLIAN